MLGTQLRNYLWAYHEYLYRYSRNHTRIPKHHRNSLKSKAKVELNSIAAYVQMLGTVSSHHCSTLLYGNFCGRRVVMNGLEVLKPTDPT